MTTFPAMVEFRDSGWNAPWEAKAGRREPGWTLVLQ